MFHRYPALRVRPIVLMLGLAVTAMLMLALAPGTARAACVLVDPREHQRSFPDVPDAGAGTAPETS